MRWWAELPAGQVRPLALDVHRPRRGGGRHRRAAGRFRRNRPAGEQCRHGRAACKLAQSADLDDWDAMVDTNVKGLMYVTRWRCCRGWSRATAGTSSISARPPANGPIPAAMSMARPRPSSASSATTCGPTCSARGCRVTDIEPGLVGGTRFSTIRFGGDAAKAAGVYAGTDPLTPEDIADTVHWVATRPARVDVNLLQVMPVAQSFGPLRVHRD